MKQRLTDVIVMDIYDVKKVKGMPSQIVFGSTVLTLSAEPGKSQYQLNLTDDEPMTGVARGTVAWLSGGLRTQVSQYVTTLLSNELVS
jgi:hypothetical protein